MNKELSVRERVFMAADQLWAESNYTTVPTVAAVRRLAGVDMNSANLYMKEWRSEKLKKPALPPSELPAELSSACMTAIGQLWQQASTLAGESFRTAMASWEAERKALEAELQQMATGFDQQILELEKLRSESTAMAERFAQVSAESTQLQQAVDAATRERDAATASAKESQLKAEAAERQLADLRESLDRAHGEVLRLAEVHAAERDRLLDEARREREKLSAKIDALSERATTAEVQAAELRGQSTRHDRPAAAVPARTARPAGGTKSKAPARAVKSSEEPQKRIRFRHPNNKKQEWTGRGPKPKWVQEWLQAGGLMDQLLVETVEPS